MAQLVIQADGPFSVWCNTCGRWVAGARINITGTHDLDESVSAVRKPKEPLPPHTDHTVWEDS